MNLLVAVVTEWTVFTFVSLFLPPSFQAVLLAQDIRDRERGGRAQIGVVEGGDERSSPELMKFLTTVLGPKPAQLKEATSDDVPDSAQKNSVRLYQ